MANSALASLSLYVRTDVLSEAGVGDLRKRLREFPADARHDAGYQLDKVQRGKQPDDFKPMPTNGKEVKEIRVWNDSGTFRVIYNRAPARGGGRPARVPKEDPGTSGLASSWRSSAGFKSQRSSDASASSKAKIAKVSSETYSNVWDAVADSPEEAANVCARAELTQQTAEAIEDSGWTQVQAATHCGITQPRMDDLLRGRVSRFSVDALVNIVTTLGRTLHFKLQVGLSSLWQESASSRERDSS